MTHSNTHQRDTGSHALSREDIELLMKDHSARTQIRIIEKLTAHYASEDENSLSAAEADIANGIFRLLLEHGEIMVRAMLAMNLSQTGKVSPELAWQMASDASNEVACPMLQYSEVMSDDALCKIIDSMADTEKLQSIASRDTVSERVSDRLVDTQLDMVVSMLLQNEGASIGDITFEKIARQFCDNLLVIESVFGRESLPDSTADKVLAHLSVVMRQHIENKYGAGSTQAKKSPDESLNEARAKMLGFKSPDRALMQQVSQLDKAGKLLPFSALCSGNLHLFEVSMSRLLGQPLDNVHILAQDMKGFKVLYEWAKLPPGLFTATGVVFEAIHWVDKKHGGGPHLSEAIDRTKESAAGKKTEGLEGLLALMRHLLSH